MMSLITYNSKGANKENMKFWNWNENRLNNIPENMETTALQIAQKKYTEYFATKY